MYMRHRKTTVLLRSSVAHKVWHKREHWWHDDWGLEIKAWVVHHNPKAWVVVDDQEVMVPDGHALRTDPCWHTKSSFIP